MIPFPDKKYSVIYADPPWNYAAGGATRNAERHYKTMKPEDIFDLPVQDIAEDDCLLFMWATFPNLDVALEAIKRGGYHESSYSPDRRPLGGTPGATKWKAVS